MAGEKKPQKPKKNGELFQLLLSTVVIGIFVLVEIWLLFYYRETYAGGFMFPLIFGILTILMVCIQTLNVYQIFVKKTVSGGVASDKKAEYLIYKQVKGLPELFDAKLQQQLESFSEEIGNTQKRTAKAILVKVEEMLANTDSESSANVLEIVSAMQTEIATLKSAIQDLKAKNEDLTNQLRSASVDHEKILENFPELQNDHKKIFDLLGSMAFRNDEINKKLDDLSEMEQQRVNKTEPEEEENFDIDIEPLDISFESEEDEEPVADAVETLSEAASELEIPEIEAVSEAEPELEMPEIQAVSEAEPEMEMSEIQALLEAEPEPEMLVGEEDSEAENVSDDVADILSGVHNDEDYDPNKQLTTEEIAAMFANVQ